MQFKSTLQKIRQVLKTTAIAAVALTLFTGLATAQTYTNGTLSTGATTLSGVAAPSGKTWSECQNPTGNTNIANTLSGAGAQISAGNSVADDFIVPAGPSWNLTKFSAYAYSTGYAGSTSPFNDIRVRIHNGNPLLGPTTIVFGDLTTNVFASSSNTNMFRIFNTVVAPASTPGTTRIIWKIEANINVTLAPGTYWVEYSVGTAQSSNFLPLSSPIGVRAAPGSNAIQYTGSWAALMDDGQGPAAPDPVATELPFSIDYTTGACAGTPNVGNTISSAASVCPATPFTLSLQNATAGSGVTYQWQSAATLAGPYTNIATATNSTYTVANLPATTYYQAIVTCSGNSDTSTPVMVALNPPSACYCIPPASNCNLDDVILNVKLGALNNTSTCSPVGGYTNYTINPAIVVPEVSIGASNSMTVTVGPGGTERVGVWIDYNRNGAFESSEFTALGSGNNVAITGSINVPAGIDTGVTRMRVRVRFSTALTGTDACTAYSFGETEDYTVNLQPCKPIVITTQPVNATTSCGGTTSFTVAATGSLPSFYWEYRASASSPWQNVPNAAPFSGVNTNTLGVTLAPYSLNGYQFRAVFQGACTAVDFSQIATLTVNQMMAAVTKTPAGAICLGGIQKLSITNIQPATVKTFTSAANLGLVIPDDASTVGVNNTIAVSGIPAGVLISSIKVKMNVTHSWAGDIVATVKAANDSIINLAYAMNGTGGAGATTSFQPTFSSTAGAVYLDGGSGNYSGTFAPDGYNTVTGDPTVPTGPNGYLPTSTTTTRNTFTNLYNPAANSSTLNGNWTLAMYDYYDDYTTSNIFNNWSIEITYTGGFANGVWTSPAPNSLFTDAAATVPYDGVTPVNTVYAKPTASGVTTYSVVVNNGVCTTPSANIDVTANKGFATGATSATTNQATCVNGNASFTATVPVGSVGAQHQWKVSTDNGATYTNVANGGIYSGATTATLSLTGVTAANNNYRFKDSIYVTTCASNVVSNAATLTVNANPVIVISASPSPELLPNTTTTLTAAVSPNPGATYMWYKDGVLVDGATGSSLVVGVDDLGTYTVNVVDTKTCGGTSNSITVSSKQSDVLFIYPSPNTGIFQVRYYSAPGNNPLPRVLNVFDSKGSRVFSQTYTVGAPYMQMNVNLSAYSKGIYSVEVSDRNGNRLKTGRVIVQ